MLKPIVGGALLVYAGVGGALLALQRKMIYFPSPNAPVRSEFGASDMTEVSYRTADGLELRSWYKAPSRPNRPVIVYFHGNAGHIGHRAEKVRPYLAAGYGVLLAEYRGYGGLPGSPTEEGLYADGRAALDYLARLDGPDLPVLYGESLGTAVAVQMAVERPSHAVVLEAPLTSAVDIARRRFPIYPAGVMLRDRYDSIAKIGRVTAPVLIVHGERDEIVPVEQGHRLLEAANKVKEGIFLPEAGHNDLYFFGADAQILDFLGRLDR
jgi:fermentation-respiration switch protein FrsA (DUF1100 family)